jgi:hypothetical protein
MHAHTRVRTHTPEPVLTSTEQAGTRSAVETGF